MIHLSVPRSVLLVFCCFFFNCSNRLIAPHPLTTDAQPTPKSKSVVIYKHHEKKVDAEDSVDFGTAFDSVNNGNDSIKPGQNTTISPRNYRSLRFPPFRVDRSVVRVLLKQSVSPVSIYSIGNVELHPNNGKTMVFRGRLFAQRKNENEIEVEAAWGKMKVQMPCTLISKNEYNYIDVEQDSYRGAIGFFKANKDSIAVVNIIEVESYLRGVVPLELGKLSKDAIEALKAQAIAARTYTYQKIGTRGDALFDVYSTTADQVYGGANVEYREADLAIRLTKDLILVYNDSIAHAYYHSTCGGRTANIEDVWSEKPPYAYCRSESDLDSSGKAYCAASKTFKWEETWAKDKFSSLVCQGVRALDPGHSYKGVIKEVHVTDSFACGRVKMCTIKGDGWTYDCGGDLLRTIFRRPVAGSPILKSANFSSAIINNKTVTVTGTGYGHGVGMCQTGAIGRANSGQSFETILHAYYHGIVICTASPLN